MSSIPITGVSTGIGRACAEMFRDRGWSVIGTVRDPACPMRFSEKSITDRTSPAKAAEEVFAAVVDRSDRLRYPGTAYARSIVRARRWLGGRAMMRFFHHRWMRPYDRS